MRMLHTMLRVGNLDRSVKFYTEVLGMKLLRTTDRPEQKYSLAFVGYDSEDKAAVHRTHLQLRRRQVRPRRGLRPHRARDARCRQGLRRREGEGRHGDARGRPGEGRNDGDRLRRTIPTATRSSSSSGARRDPHVVRGREILRPKCRIDAERRVIARRQRQRVAQRLAARAEGFAHDLLEQLFVALRLFAAAAPGAPPPIRLSAAAGRRRRRR